MIKLKDTRKSYIKVAVFGLIIGLITEICNLLPNEGLLGLSSIAGSFGFWIFTTTFVIYFSCSNKNAMINTFLYLAGMCVGYYILDAFVVVFTPNLEREGVLDWSKLTFWGGASVLCALVAVVLYYWNRDKWYSSILYALPAAGMLVDTIGCILKFYYSHTQLVTCVLNVIFLVIMIVFFFRKAKIKIAFVVALIVVSIVGYYVGAGNASYNVTTQSQITCELNGETESFYIKMRDDGVILEKTGNAEVYEAIKVDSLHSVPEIIHALQDYYESRGGSVETGE